MVSSLNLAYIHLRLEEIFGADKWFGGKTMLFVGDNLQLPPVNGTPVFQQVPNKVISLRLGSIGLVNIWKEAVLYDELTINECQKYDKIYTDLLDGVRRGFPSQEALELLAQRVLDKPVIEKFNELRMLVKLPYVFFPLEKHVRKSTQSCWPLYLLSLLHYGALTRLMRLLLLQSGTSVPRSV